MSTLEFIIETLEISRRKAEQVCDIMEELDVYNSTLDTYYKAQADAYDECLRMLAVLDINDTPPGAKTACTSASDAAERQVQA